MLFPIFLFIFALHEIKCENPSEDSGISFDEDKWDFLMLRTDKLQFNFTKHLYGILPKSKDLRKKGLEFYGEKFLEDGHPNLDIKFQIGPDESLICLYRVFLTPTTLGIRYWKGFYTYEGNKAPQQTEREDQFKEAMELEAPFVFNPKGNHEGRTEVFIKQWKENEYSDIWMEGGGTFNEPVEDPQCFYDFYKVATGRDEYELLKYCAKGYFYRGFDYGDERARLMRKDWILYLMKGELICNVSDSTNPNAVEYNRELLDKGYKIQMFHFSGNDISNCRDDYVLSQYKDKDKDGKFMLAGIFGSAKFQNGNEDLCYGRATGWDHRDSNGKYLFTLSVGHYCTKAKEKETLKFDLSFNPDDVPNGGIQEDIGVQILLDRGLIRFATNHFLCDEHTSDKNCEAAKKEVRSVLNLPNNEWPEEMKMQQRSLFSNFTGNSTTNSTQNEGEMFGAMNLTNSEIEHFFNDTLMNGTNLTEFN